MLKKILQINGTESLSKTTQKEINGGLSPEPITGPGGGGGSGGNNDSMPCYCFTFRGLTQVPCNSTCADGTQPICP
ncbi:hypothetical protein [Kordia sp.]|uniref:hypothetical protein n=1 Tax=Kordia sp. TaxID=1965332 RepID=UPI003D296595